jgi:uncharacterized membrane protein YtjA (UPF0391 family)
MILRSNLALQEEGMVLRASAVALLVVAVVAGSVALAGPAQDILGSLAEEARAQRVMGGYVMIGTGLAVGVGSAIFLAGSGYEVYGYLAGGLIALPGVIALVSPSNVEREFARAGDSEALSALALEELAADGRRNRYISGIANAAAGIASLVYPINIITAYDYLYSALTSFGLAALDFLLPSKEERAYAQYLELAGTTP